MASIIIKLETQVEAFNRKYDEVGLKEPTGALYGRLGEPRITVYNEKSTSIYFIEQGDIIRQYLDRLVDIGVPDAAAQAAVISGLSLTDMRRLKDALFSFFDQAAQKAAALKWTTSSSD